MIFRQQDHVKNLPDCYKKTQDSNNAKILTIEQDAVNLLRAELQAVLASGDIFEATGKTLDLYGDMVGQARGAATDDQYRYMIRLKIVQNISSGDYVSVLNALSLAFGCDHSQIHIQDSEAACSATLVTAPLGAITESGLTVNQAVALIQRLMPICVTLESASFEGTFMFSDSETEYDESHGFSEAEGGEIGGYLGFIHSDENDSKLPI